MSRGIHLDEARRWVRHAENSHFEGDMARAAAEAAIAAAHAAIATDSPLELTFPDRVFAVGPISPPPVVASDDDPEASSGEQMPSDWRRPDVLSFNQVVAFNLMRARRRKGWTQEETAERLSAAMNRKWTDATLSAAERSWRTGRTREFNADELFAFSHVFEIPVSDFFLRPDTPELKDAPISFAKRTTKPTENAPEAADHPQPLT